MYDPAHACSRTVQPIGGNLKSDLTLKMAALKAIPQSHFQNCFEVWTRRWHWCIASQGDYYEGDHGGIQQ
jgi:hypothetical protein